MDFRKPLLYGEIVPNFFLWIKRAADDGVCAICAYKVFCRQCTAFAVFKICNTEFAGNLFNGNTDRSAVDFDGGRDDRFQPKVEFVTVEIDIKPLIVADELIFQVDSFDGKDLRIYEDILWQSHIKTGERFLRIAGNQAAAGFLEAAALCAEYFFIQCDDAEFWAEQTRQRGAGRAKADDSNIIM